MTEPHDMPGGGPAPRSSISEADEDDISLLDLLQVVVDNLRLLVLGPLVAGLLALGISFVVTPTFTATTKFLPPQQQQSAATAMLQSLGALGGLAGAATGLKNPNDQFVAFMQSRSMQDKLLDRFQLMARYEADYKQDARKELTRNTRISSGKDSIITVEVDDKDPALAARLANAHVEELGLMLGRLAITEAQQRRKFFENQLASTKENLIKAEQALKASGVNSSALKSNPQTAITGLAQLKASITAQEVKLASMRGYLSESAPDFQQAQRELSALRAQMSRAEREEPASDGDSDYVSKYRDFKYHETLFELFAKQFEIARVDESREGAVIQVVDTALPPERKSKPQRALITVLATLGTAFVLLLFVFVRQALRKAKGSPESAVRLDQLRQAWRLALGRR
jgi:tyrosine-protein kinase Etk/Wzc